MTWAAAIAVTAVIAAPCPGDHHALGCYVVSSQEVYVNPDWSIAWRRTTLWHELGHSYNAKALSQRERKRISRMFGWHRFEEEHFADAFASCRYRHNTRQRAKTYLPRPRLRFCHYLHTKALSG